MSSNRQKIVQELKSAFADFEPKHFFVPALVGDSFGNVAVSGRTSFIYVRIHGIVSSKVQALNLTGFAFTEGKQVQVEVIQDKRGGVSYEVVKSALTAPPAPIAGGCAAMTTPVSGDFAWRNQDSATIDVSSCGVYLFSPKANSQSIHIREKAVPTAPYTVTIAITPQLTGEQNNHCGLCLVDSASGKFVNLSVYDYALNAAKWDSVTQVEGFQTNYRNTPGAAFGGHGPLWLRVNDDNTNRILSWAMDGQHFVEFHSVGRTDFITPDKIGFFATCGGGGLTALDVGMTLQSWLQE